MQFSYCEIEIHIYCLGTPTWADLRELGMAWWIRNNNILRKLIEKVAKASFQKTQDPLDAAIFYLAMKKKSLVWGLYRSIKDEKMTAFFKNNFSEDRWRKAALKNAFALLGKQRFTHAAAFFLLSGSLKDALDICIGKNYALKKYVEFALIKLAQLCNFAKFFKQ